MQPEDDLPFAGLELSGQVPGCGRGRRDDVPAPGPSGPAAESVGPEAPEIQDAGRRVVLQLDGQARAAGRYVDG